MFWDHVATRLLLILLSLASFVPQTYRFLDGESYDGVSLTYILFNLIVATEQFTLGLHLIAVEADGNAFALSTPRSTGEWLNLFQFGVVWLGHTVFYLCCLQLPLSRTAQKRTTVAFYMSFLLISLVLVAFEASLPPETEHSSPESEDRRWFMAVFIYIHTRIINPVVTAVGITALYFQARETIILTSPGALSVVGLLIQAVVFTLVGISLLYRVTLPDEFWDMSPIRGAIVWYELVGWAAVDNFVFAFVQFTLLFIALRCGSPSAAGGERAPLLSQSAHVE